MTRQNSSIFTLLFSICLALYYWGPNLQAKWGIIDDHAIMNYIGDRFRLGAADIPKLMIRETEVGQPGRALRYRPSYFFLYLLECATWGKNPHLWYISRLVMFIISIYLFASVLIPFCGVPVSWAYLVAMTSYRYWSDIFGRLGPAEIYATFGTALYTWAFQALWVSAGENLAMTHSTWIWVLLTLGGLIAIGAKENFVFLAAFQTALLVRWFYYRRLSTGRAPILSSISIIAYSTFILVSVTLALSKVGHDIYSNSNSGFLLPVLKHQILKIHLIQFCWLVGLGFMLATYSSLDGTLFKVPRQKWRSLFLLLSGLISVYIFQIIFYHGQWPTGVRYDFPGRPLPWLSLLLLITFLAKEFSNFKRILQSALICGFALMFMRQYEVVREMSKQNRDKTIAFTSAINHLSVTAESHPDWPIVVVSHNVWDEEPIFSVGRFFRAGGVRNDLYLKTAGYNEQTSGAPLEKALTRTIEMTSRSGSEAYLPLNKARLRDSGSACIGIGLSGPPPTECRKAMNI